MNGETLAKAAKVLGVYVGPCGGDAFWVKVGGGHKGGEWLTTPDGRDFVERRLVEMGYAIESSLSAKFAAVAIHGGEGHDTVGADAATPAEALIAAVAKLVPTDERAGEGER